jgi:glycosyltransferase involved in cell wall biosynthesis
MERSGTRISVGITCYGNEDSIGPLLLDIENQVFTSDRRIAEIIVVASGCTDNTLAAVRPFVARDPRIRLIVESRRSGKPSAINKILQSLEGSVLVLLSGDVRLPDGHFVEGLVSHCTDTISVVGCRPVPVNDRNTPAGYIGHLMWSMLDKTLMAEMTNGLCKQAGEAFAITRDAAEEIPLDVINDDAYLVLKAQLAGHGFAYAREIIVRNRTPDRIRDILLQRARIIRGHLQLKEIIGISPTDFRLRRPLIVVKVGTEEIKEQIANRKLRISGVLQAILLELAAHLLSRIWNPTNLWPKAESVKRDREDS